MRAGHPDGFQLGHGCHDAAYADRGVRRDEITTPPAGAGSSSDSDTPVALRLDLGSHLRVTRWAPGAEALRLVLAPSDHPCHIPTT